MALFLGGFVAVVWLDGGLRTEWCGGNEPDIVCYREWVAALSGWAAAIAAAAGLLYLSRQVRLPYAQMEIEQLIAEAARVGVVAADTSIMKTDGMWHLMAAVGVEAAGEEGLTHEQRKTLWEGCDRGIFTIDAVDHQIRYGSTTAPAVAGPRALVVDSLGLVRESFWAIRAQSSTKKSARP